MNTDITPPAPDPAPTIEAPQPPVMDVQPPAPAPAPDVPADKQRSKESPEPAKPAPKAVKPKAPKQPGSGVGFAIAATVVIVLGLAALATYAYLQTK